MAFEGLGFSFGFTKKVNSPAPVIAKSKIVPFQIINLGTRSEGYYTPDNVFHFGRPSKEAEINYRNSQSLMQNQGNVLSLPPGKVIAPMPDLQTQVNDLLRRIIALEKISIK